MKLKPIELISLAGLLHDIGKVRQRAQEKIINPYNKEYCKSVDNHPSYIHAAHTAEFLDNFVKDFNIEANSQEENLINIASYHHKEMDESLYKIVRVADRLASGFERKRTDDESDFRKARLLSIFSSIKTSANYTPNKTYWPIKKLDYDVVPDSKPTEEDESSYKNLYNALKNDIKKIKTDNFDIFFDSLNYVLEQYLWGVPSSSYHTKADISLYDHLKVSAAFAAALYRYFENANTIPNPNDDTECFCLIQGDFSGIQKFIFSSLGESNKFAAKILRARSFFVSLSTELVAFELCKTLGLSKASIVMNAGGKFTILGANVDDVEQKIQQVLKKVNSEFWRLSFGQTQFAIDYITLAPKDFMSESNPNNFSAKYEQLVLKLESAKLKPDFDSYVFDDYLKSVSQNGICKICGMHPATQTIDYTGICESCLRMKTIGEKLVKSDSFGITQEGEIAIFGQYHLSFDRPSNALLTFDISFGDTFNGYAKSKISTYVPRLTENDINDIRYRDLKDIEKLKANDIKPFSCIARDSLILKQGDENSQELVGSDFLGILKADVDNLGYIFSKGFKNEGQNISFSKIVSLSRMIDFFFTGWLQNEIRSNFTSIYTVFSGGDDLFLIGPFSQIIDLSLKINDHLKKYTQNDDIHLSCGIYFAKDKIPVYQMARMAEENLEKSKHIAGKNAITVFDKTLSWDEFETLMNIDMEALLKDVSESYKYRIFTYIDMAENIKSNHFKTHDLMWKALFVYNAYRNVGKGLGKDERNKAIEEFLKLSDYIEKYSGKLIVPLSNYIYRNRRKHV